MAEQHDIEMDQGASFDLQVQYTDTAGTAIDLTGYTCRLQIRRNVADHEEAAGLDPVLDLTSSPVAGLTLTPGTGTIAIALTDEQTQALDGTYVYDLKMESGAGKVTRLIEGSILIKPEVTR